MDKSMQKRVLKAQQILKAQSVPIIPEEILLLKEELGKKYPNTVTIANLISKNPENLSLFLKIANSSVINEETEIKDAKAAVNLIGLGDLFNLFLTTVLSRLLVTNRAEEQIMKEGIQTGIVAAELSYWVYDVSRSEAFMLGLLLNTGYLFLRRHFPEYDDSITRLKTHPLSYYPKEIQAYETDHCLISSIVGKKWSLPEKIIRPVLFHHDKEFALKLHAHRVVSDMVALSMVASYIVSSSDKEYLTSESKAYGELGAKHLEMSEKAFKAGRAALEKWGSVGSLMTGSH